ncbi:hypothetical protein KXD97_22135 [Mycobacterium sp. SMC-8]|uniref:hypothetical protein n=1 Tax=Mycobacterium sp. SMC-8 TaxID=2857060 RepID=UPI0021B3F14B|nr:hypothetical protein [Mycobacterium sp. SMC-8]UXA10762.1 hypothetical protein KXD97_22135 [Mycobacterium sp. SMC-8]
MSTNAYEPNPRRVLTARFLFSNPEEAARAAAVLDDLDLGQLAAETVIEERI